MKRHIHLLLIVALCSCLSELMAANVAPRPLSTTYHVSPTGQESNDGLSWAQALATITNAVARAGTGDRVVVSNGTYVVPATGSATTPWIVIDKGITVESVEGPDATILDGASAAYRRGVSISHADAVFSGFTIRNIRSSISSMGQGGALQITAGTVTNCVIRNYWGSWSGAIGMTGGLLIDSRVLDNKSDDSLSQAGGIHLLSGSPQVIGCEISGNHAKLGAGVYLNVAGARLSRSVIHGNVNDPTGRGASGAIHLINGLVEQCVITNNTGLRGGGVQLLGGSVRNCLIARNRDLGATGGGGVHQAGGTLDACTIALNTCLGRGNGLHQTGGSCINTIVAHNGLLGLFRDIDNLHRTGGTFTFNCAYPPQAGNGNLAAAPGFVDLAGGNLRLAPATPCRNAGSNSAWMTGATDLDGQPRLVETTVDLGVFEAVPTNTLPFACDIVATPTDGLAPFEVTLEARIFNAPAAVSACNWDFGDSTAGSGATVTNTYDTGCFTVTLTVVTPAGNASRTITNLVCGGTSRAYVATDGTHVWPFETPLKAATNIQTALDVLLLPDADTRGVVTVAPGTYAHRNAVSTIQVTRKILLKSDSGPVQTILDGALRGLVLNGNRSRRLFARVSARRMRTRVGYGPSQSNRYGV